MLTREQAQAIYRAGEETVIRVLLEMDARINALEERVKTLESQIAKNSSNSSKPPSTDGYTKPAPKSQRPASERPAGGQNGHSGHTLRRVAKPDRIITHTVKQCAGCGHDLSGQKSTAVEKRQVFDLPPIKVEVTEHQAETKVCPRCGQVNQADFPKEVNAPTQYGQRLKAVAVYLKDYQLLPYQRTAELLADLFGCSLSEGTLARFTQQCSGLLQKTVAQIKDIVRKAPVAGFDETGCSVNDRLHWLHVACTPSATYYEIHPKRGALAMDALGILPDFTGRAIHDFWKPYFTYSCAHGLCNAHHLRELTFIYEQDSQLWAKEMMDLLVEIKNAVDECRQRNEPLPENQRRTFESRYQQLLDIGYLVNPLPEKTDGGSGKRGKHRKSKAGNLLERLDLHRREVLAFMSDFRVPFDNNQSERDLRMMKVQQKISGAFRSLNGAQAFCRIRSYLSTARKNAAPILDAIAQVFAGKAAVPLCDTG